MFLTIFKLRSEFTIVIVDELRAGTLRDLDHELQRQEVYDFTEGKMRNFEPKDYVFFEGGYVSTYWDEKGPKGEHVLRYGRNYVDFGPLYGIDAIGAADMEFLIFDAWGTERWRKEVDRLIIVSFRVSLVAYIGCWLPIDAFTCRDRALSRTLTNGIRIYWDTLIFLLRLPGDTVAHWMTNDATAESRCLCKT